MPATDDQTFEHFVPGRASAEAFAAATALARAQPGSLRLLMLCGPPGVGKTHLFRAVVNMVRMRDRSAEITETTAFDVIQDRIARRDENAPGLRVPHAEWLVLDDLHVLAGKPVTQAEVGRLLEAVVGRGARVVCASGGSPTRIPVLADAVQRLSAGRVIEMEPPTPQEMRRIIAARAAAVGLRPGGASLALLADEARGDVRCAIGGLTRLRFAASARAGARLT